MCVTCGFVPSVQKVIVGISPSPITTFIEGKDDDIVPTSQRKISVDIFSLSFYNVFTAGKTTTDNIIYFKELKLDQRIGKRSIDKF